MDRAALDEAVSTLQRNKSAWLETPIDKKIEYARGILDGFARVAARQVEAVLQAKGLDPDTPVAGGEWLAGPYTQIRVIRTLLRSLEEIQDLNTVRVGSRRIATRSDGQVVVHVFPKGIIDRLLYQEFRADIWMRHGVTEDNLLQHVGAVYRDPGLGGKVALVLGGGNVASIAPCDAIHKLFVEGQVVLLKLHPVNEYLGPFIEEAFSHLIDDGFLRVVRGGAETGEYLCLHDGIEEIHMTGGEATHDAIVFGPGEEGAGRKRRNEPRIDKRITSELGNVSPVVVVPGEWSAGDIRFHAENVATQMFQNAGFNCNACKVIVTHRDWPQRQEFLDGLREVLRSLPPQPAYYPGAEERYERFLEAHLEAEPLGDRSPGVLPPALIPDVDPGRKEALAFTTESFCSIAAETALPGNDPGSFLGNAVEFCNGTLRGTLNAGILVDPRTRHRLGMALNDAVSMLRFGAIGINHWAAMSFVLGTTTWGAFPGHTLDDIQSGIGVVHNTMLFDRAEKSVVDGPFRVRPKPPWFLTHENAHRVGPLLVELEATQNLAKLPGVIAAALRG